MERADRRPAIRPKWYAREVGSRLEPLRVQAGLTPPEGQHGGDDMGIAHVDGRHPTITLGTVEATAEEGKHDSLLLRLLREITSDFSFTPKL